VLPETSFNLRVLVMHSAPVLATGIHDILALQPDVSVQTLENRQCPAHPTPVDVVVADFETGKRLLTDASSFQASAGYAGGTRLLIITTHDRERDVRTALELGAHGYLFQDCTIQELVEAIRIVGKGSRYLCAGASRCLADSFCRERLTLREQQILDLLAQGHSNKAMARELDLALGTIKAHVKAILSKLNAQSRTQALSIAVHQGLVTHSAGEESRSKAIPRLHVGRTPAPATFTMSGHARRSGLVNRNSTA
jgi:DNA-binding NarL/FixJ family response regulator